MQSLASLLLGFPLFLASCSDNSKTAAPTVLKNIKPVSNSTAVTAAVVTNANTPAANAATIMARKQVPVLCYHHIHDFTGREKPVTKDYIVPPANFREQIKSLADSGYH